MSGARIYQLKIVLKELEPPIWRRVQVSADITLKRLHDVIQSVMGWSDYHLFRFEAEGILYHKPAPEWDLDEDAELRDATRHRLGDVLHKPGQHMTYLYDLGDHWVHDVVLEEIVEPTTDGRYPTCIGGARACPPEDCGGVVGYIEFCEAVLDREHPEHEAMLKWCGGSFDPEAFDLQATDLRLERYRAQAPGKARRKPGSIKGLAVQALREAGGPLEMEALREYIVARGHDLRYRWQSRLRSALTTDNPYVVRVGQNLFDLTSRRLAGVAFRYRLSESEIAQGRLLADGDVAGLLSWDEWVDWSCLQAAVRDERGETVPVRFLIVRERPIPDADKPWERLGRIHRIIAGLNELFERAGARGGDDLLVRVDDADEKRFTFRVEPSRGLSPTERAAVKAADEELTRECLRSLERSQGTSTPRDLIVRVAGMLDLRSGPAPHFPLFCLATRPEVRYDGLFYALARHRDDNPPRPEPVRRPLPTEDSLRDMFAASLRALLPGLDKLEPVDDLINQLVKSVPEDLEHQWRQEYKALDELLQARALVLKQRQPGVPR